MGNPKIDYLTKENLDKMNKDEIMPYLYRIDDGYEYVEDYHEDKFATSFEIMRHAISIGVNIKTTSISHWEWRD